MDQSNPDPGVAALPVSLAQCDAVISIVDDSIYDRAWCSVETMAIQTLQRSYGFHKWYEQVPCSRAKVESTETHSTEWCLREGPMDMTINMAEKELSLESDRPNVMFLERQQRLLGTE